MIVISRLIVPPLVRVASPASMPFIFIDCIVSDADLTVRKKLLTAAPPGALAPTFMLLLPVGIEVKVEMVRVELQGGLQDAGENDAVAPVGSLDAEKVTGCVVPDIRVAVTVLVTEKPWVTDLSPSMEREKVIGGLRQPVGVQVLSARHV